ncbi:extracellular solute-binding protein [Tepidibacillus decaturensis]|uniref:Iron ABC transporter substrate-binding protein n=1 Tax=Tepidibacillus decaturensis TaxID=1413211 RepID=A0A135L6G1_9BACI|nr:extracellular solute-binding protein [Tepidibacillus decaturensis]KXG44578.1 iron ABC transporter substrate-binding protein [Tepidibacillus decaturensis]
MNWKKSLYLFVAVAMIFTLVATGCSSSNETTKNTNDQKEQTTDKSNGLEEKVVIYSPHGKDILGQFEKMFEEKNPGVDVQWLDLGSQEVLDRIRSEAQNPQADLWWGAPSVMFSEAKDAGLLEPYQPSYASTLAAEFHDKDWAWTGTSQTPEVIMYNTKFLSKEEAPKDWDDLLDPKWKDKIIIRYPLASGTMRTIYSAIIYRDYKDTKDPTKGYEWLKALDQNTKEYSANHEMMYNKVAKGEGIVSLWDMPDVVMLKEQKNYPFDFIIPESGTPVLTEGIAIIKGAKHPEAAKAFYEFVNSPEATKILAEQHFRIPTRNDITDLPDWIKNTTIKPMDIDWKVFQEKSNEWMQYWDENIKNKAKQVK